MTPSELRAGLAGIRRLASLGDGWDSYGAARISPEAIEAAQRGLVEISDLPKPWIVPSPEGGVVFTYESDSDDATMHIEYDVNGELQVLVWADDEPVDQEPAEL